MRSAFWYNKSMKPQITWLVVAIVVLVVALVVFFVFVGAKPQTPASNANSAPAAPATTSSTQSLGAQIYSNVAPQAAVPQSLPQTNPFGQ